ncbi:dynein regulatory complex protein 10-like [Neodiprion pinetum]|uniref:Dynein regulatory complex protein 10 n=1 Tax=Neodiprion lecontei TaxID=441921 RepID=A0A6J0B798_NEOLC|nr:dynein regulatory complex protein 10-like [Neodiprion lecontei]XP_046489285.1 dynein regulatory complex protein 10-like [Neodiprion pinetum]
MKHFFEHTLKRISTSPEEYRAKELRYRKLWRENEKAKTDLKILAAVLEEQRKQHDMEMELINSQCEKDLATVKRINRKCKEDVNYTIIRTERKMMIAYKASEMKQKEIREDVSNAEFHLKKIRTLNLALEKEARDKRFKIESQLLGIINKYDTEIGEKQKQMELLIVQFETDKKKKEDLEAEIERQADLYDTFMKEKQDTEDAIINEKLAKLMMTRAVKTIQRWWHSMREKRKAKIAKKKTKNKKLKKKK